jgi:hypothetical protein
MRTSTSVESTRSSRTATLMRRRRCKLIGALPDRSRRNEGVDRKDLFRPWCHSTGLEERED